MGLPTEDVATRVPKTTYESKGPKNKIVQGAFAGQLAPTGWDVVGPAGAAKTQCGRAQVPLVHA